MLSFINEIEIKRKHIVPLSLKPWVDFSEGRALN